MKPPLKEHRLHCFCVGGVAGGGWQEILPVEKRGGGGGHKRNCYIPRLSLN